MNDCTANKCPNLGNQTSTNFVAEIGLRPDVLLKKNVHSQIESHILQNRLYRRKSEQRYLDNDLDLYTILDRLSEYGEVKQSEPDTFVLFRDDCVIELIIIDQTSPNCPPWYVATVFAKSYAVVNHYIGVITKQISKNYPDLSLVSIRTFMRKFDGEIFTKSVEEPINESVYGDSYPFINDGNIYEYAHNFLSSEETILTLLGPPGTGKTKLVRYILREAKNREENKETVLERTFSNQLTIFYTNSTEVLHSDEIFEQFLSDNFSILVLEDIDFHLYSRKQDNPLMYKLLGLADGLISCTNNKIIISTNIADEKDIDPALIRPGRCFDLAKFRNLTYDEAKDLISKISPERDLKQADQKKDNYTLSELYKFAKTGSIKEEKSDEVKSSTGLGF